MNLLGLDYGRSHIGVALATGPLAEPLVTIPTKNAIQLIKELIVKYNVDKIIIGQPDASLKFEFEKFINLFQISNLPGRQAGFKFQTVDETLSSHDARQSLMHTSPKKRKNQEHSAAAAIILQSWIDSNI